MPGSEEGNKLEGKGGRVGLQLEKFSIQQLFHLKSEGEIKNGEE